MNEPHRPLSGRTGHNPRGVLCKARGCAREIATGYLMCGRHWRMVPKEVQREISKNWNPRQAPSRKYVEAVKLAIDAVARQEGLL